MPDKTPCVNYGDDCVVVFPSGKQAAGRVEDTHRGRAVVDLDNGGTRVYPWSWVYAWEDAPDDPEFAR